MLDWIVAHIETVLAVVAFVVAGLKARKAGGLNEFLVSKIDGIATKEEKEAIKAQSVAIGVEKVLAPVVKKVTKGDGGGVLGLIKGLIP